MLRLFEVPDQKKSPDFKIPRKPDRRSQRKQAGRAGRRDRLGVGPLMTPTCTLIPVPRLALGAMLIEVEALAAVAV
jgi:hypothetical protein